MSYTETPKIWVVFGWLNGPRARTRGPFPLPRQALADAIRKRDRGYLTRVERTQLGKPPEVLWP